MRLTGKVSQDTQGSGDETNTDRNDKNGVTGHRHRAVQKRQTGMTGDETDRNDETRLTDRNDWRRDRPTDRNDSSIWLGYLLFHLLLQKTSLKSL